MTTTDSRSPLAGNGLSPAARSSARDRLTAIAAAGDEFDSLTDLFLGEVAGTTPAPAPRPHVSSPAPEPLAAYAAPATPAFSAAPAPPTPPTQSVDTPIIEALVIGHVPVLASAWASQYVREVVQAARRPAAFIRILGDVASVELVEPVGVPTESLDERASDSIDDAIARAARHVNRWIIQSSPITESHLAAAQDVRLITLLTGADEAARVAGYGAVKRLSEHLRPDQPGSPAAMIRVATVGVPSAVAGQAGQRIVEAVRQFLSRDAQQASCSPKIRAGRPSRVLFSGTLEVEPAQVLEFIRHAAAGSLTPAQSEAQVTASAEVPVTHTPLPPLEPAAIEHPEPREAPAAEVAAEATEDAIDPLPPEPPEVIVRKVAPSRIDSHTTSHTHSNTPSHAYARPIEPESAPRTAPAPSRVPSPTSSLCAHVPGLSRLIAECPTVHGVEIALDDDGGVHVLADGRGGEWRVNSAIADALIASAWVEAHLSLIAPIAPGPRRASLHIFVDQPRFARRMLDTPLKFHLLAEVPAGDSAAWYCVELN